MEFRNPDSGKHVNPASNEAMVNDALKAVEKSLKEGRKIQESIVLLIAENNKLVAKARAFNQTTGLNSPSSQISITDLLNEKANLEELKLDCDAQIAEAEKKLIELKQKTEIRRTKILEEFDGPEQ
jgi:hypothetical protein